MCEKCSLDTSSWNFPFPPVNATKVSPFCHCCSLSSSVCPLPSSSAKALDYGQPQLRTTSIVMPFLVSRLLVFGLDRSSASWFRPLGVHAASIHTPHDSACAISSIKIAQRVFPRDETYHLPVYPLNARTCAVIFALPTISWDRKPSAPGSSVTAQQSWPCVKPKRLFLCEPRPEPSRQAHMRPLRSV